MIYIKDQTISEEEFLSLLQSSKDDLTLKGPLEKVVTGLEFEELVYNAMVEKASNTRFSGLVERAGKHGFPDIIAAKFYGVEVKMTVGDKWTTTGNSVLETTRSEDVRRIYMFFGKLGNTFEIKYRLYQECLSDVGVTHSPRYKIDMDLPNGESIFDKLGIEYDLFRQEKNPIVRLKKYYSSFLKKGEELWWMDSSEKTVSPIIKTMRKMSADFKEKFRIETMILFPEIFGSSSLKYERPAIYLITEHNVVSMNIRDIYTAGGVRTITGKNGKPTEISQILSKLHEDKDLFIKTLNEISEELLISYWKVENISENRIEQWKEILKSNTSEEVFNRVSNII